MIVVAPVAVVMATEAPFVAALSTTVQVCTARAPWMLRNAAPAAAWLPQTSVSVTVTSQSKTMLRPLPSVAVFWQIDEFRMIASTVSRWQAPPEPVPSISLPEITVSTAVIEQEAA